MDPSDKNSNRKLCEKHSQPIIWYDSYQDQLLCTICVQKNTRKLSDDQIKQKQWKIRSKSNKEFYNEQQLLQGLLDSIETYKQDVINTVDKITLIIIEQIQNINSFKEKFEQQLASTNQVKAFNQLKEQIKNQKDNHKQFLIQIQQLLSEYQIPINNIGLDQVSSQSYEETLSQDDLAQNFQYELNLEGKKKEDEHSLAFAFNKDNTILVVGQFTMIKIFQFNNGEIGKELQTLRDHDYSIRCLYVMKSSNDFVSGSMDQSIIIWKNFINNKWVQQQKLTGHLGYVNCLLMNKNEHLLISGSEDETIKFWKKAKDQWSCYQTIDTDNLVFSISLNEIENKLISCGYSNYVLVMETKNNQKWSITQKIYVEEYGKRLCFTFNNQFVYQPLNKDYLIVYDFDSSLDQFIKQQQVKIQSCEENNTLFPCHYLVQLNILLVKHGEYLNIFRINENNNYELIQTINYDDNEFYGTVSCDGKYLITSESRSKEIQVRRMIKINK